MRQASQILILVTPGRGLVEFTHQAREFVASSGVKEGLLSLFCRHTSASLLIQENADPDVRHDLDAFFAKLAPDGQPGWRHANEGPDDMSAHIRSALTQTSLAIPVIQGGLALGAWQGLYLWEHRYQSHRREVVMHLFGA